MGTMLEHFPFCRVALGAIFLPLSPYSTLLGGSLPQPLPMEKLIGRSAKMSEKQRSRMRERYNFAHDQKPEPDFLLGIAVLRCG
jgi:hypothetical protein